jgi:hypothetical protein
MSSNSCPVYCTCQALVVVTMGDILRIISYFDSSSKFEFYLSLEDQDPGLLSVHYSYPDFRCKAEAKCSHRSLHRNIELHFCKNCNRAGVQFRTRATLFRKQTNWIRPAPRASGLGQKWHCGVPSLCEERQKGKKAGNVCVLHADSHSCAISYVKGLTRGNKNIRELTPWNMKHSYFEVKKRRIVQPNLT